MMLGEGINVNSLQAETFPCGYLVLVYTKPVDSVFRTL